MIYQAQKTNIKNQKSKAFSGYTLIELLVVLLVFTILAYVIVQSLALSLRGSRKSENLGQVKGNVEYAMNVMERHLRNARGIPVGGCTPNQITYQDEWGTATNPYFSCVGGANGYIASGSARLTSTEIYIDCTAGNVFDCPPPTAGVPPSIIINLVGRDANSSGAEGADVTSTTKLLLRIY
ncbi:hypothetical protein A2962_04740 [Candidatus Woesebacteria bacterium RIFCSPLOWO2_01_FULL_39_61]|uniref:Uncharacterized protein n=1 Tax=Candidatus Woesebacteria bacterium RIFCSPHIGHO2_02_FULL_39_13 TaxID=1802505 RepID=A0A1F7Z454_9BACT|nr:MAG: hypothetical protein A2692_01060 [Candidatus Woesebacteria bacterium RIFCSPHIGHO2_01_FULL_39_95]OGM34307.1 MAG: hypothetical protein A3D01_00865 [Candidatus Woesebacteria bacterium RIFCSPHIGHO2_02_FULL_39_13]OGM39089.1 MAG: hypothetical protein A3E13_01590 [Candidatus Woesebacteria bacterium RIFCSPHIGHO2_12_FULL_40_20]OGM68644.1 MAG: hypothetical protein A2962_04740 [Candidatus Woesebacteria bacterium RIFCSPLOWO2_01_FULL_39_61]